MGVGGGEGTGLGVANGVGVGAGRSERVPISGADGSGLESVGIKLTVLDEWSTVIAWLISTGSLVPHQLFGAVRLVLEGYKRRLTALLAMLFCVKLFGSEDMATPQVLFPIVLYRIAPVPSIP